MIGQPSSDSPNELLSIGEPAPEGADCQGEEVDPSSETPGAMFDNLVLSRSVDRSLGRTCIRTLRRRTGVSLRGVGDSNVGREGSTVRPIRDGDVARSVAGAVNRFLFSRTQCGSPACLEKDIADGVVAGNSACAALQKGAVTVAPSE